MLFFLPDVQSAIFDVDNSSAFVFVLLCIIFGHLTTKFDEFVDEDHCKLPTL